MRRYGLVRWPRWATSAFRIGWACPSLLVSLLVGCAQSQGREPVEICSVLDRQVEAWNRGDIEGFMQGYWKSGRLEFITPQGTTRGWQATLDRYRAKYSTRELMGTLSFERLCVKQTASDSADVTGRYRVETTSGSQSGQFVLQMRRIDGAWVIVRDETIGDS